MPWKNGGGETTEIAVWPKNALLDDFEWRVSMARVEADGPFSPFADVDRTLVILEGAGLELTIENQPSLVLTKDALPTSFPADIPTFATLRAGAIVDLNIMTRRGVFRHSVEKISKTYSVEVDCSSDMTLVFARLPVNLSYANGGTALDTSDAVFVKSKEERPLHFKAEKIEVVLIRLWREC